MPTRTPRILCVDDDIDHCEMMQTMLHFSGGNYEFTSVSTPDEGLRLASAKRFDLYLLDYRFGRTTGVEMCRALRRRDAVTPIIFFSGEAHPQARQEAMEAGANAYLVKPDDLKKLTETVKGLLGSRHHNGDAAARVVPRQGHDSGVSA